MLSLPAISLLLFLGVVGGATNDQSYVIAGIRTYLYYPDTGRFDTRELGSTPYLALWNTIIGEGDSESPSATTLVLVDVNGPSFLSTTKGEVALVATIDGRKVLDEQVPFSTLFSTKMKVTVPYLIHGTGCGELQLTASVKGPRSSRHSHTQTINFACGE